MTSEEAMAPEEERGSYTLQRQGDVEAGDDADKWAIPAANGPWQSADEDATEIPLSHSRTDDESLELRDKLNDCSCPEKTVYMLGVTTLVVVTCSMMSFPWFLPYLYTFYLSVLVPFRAWKYSTMNWHLFLLDWCYVSNALNLLFLWVAPYESRIFMLIFAASNGPVIWSVVLFRNCLVPHSIERLTCLVVHLMPSLVTYVVRWQPAATSLHWYREFTDGALSDFSVGSELIWLLVVPFGCYTVHLVIYLSLTLSLCDSSKYPNNYTYIVIFGDGCMSRAVKCLGERFKLPTYIALQCAYASLTMTLTWLLFHFRAAHVVFLCGMFAVATYNGSTYYLDLFPRKSYESDPYRLCGHS